MIATLAKKVFKDLGPGYSERVYHNAMEVGLRLAGIKYETERTVNIRYENHVVGCTRADLIVDNDTVVELKATNTVTEAHRNQVRRYLSDLCCSRGILINFPPRGEDCLIEYIEMGNCDTEL